MSGTQLIADASRMPAFRVDPAKLTIVGLDTEDGAEHPLWDKRICLPIDPGLVASIDAHGIVMPIRVAVENGITYVVAGRQRVRSARLVNEQRAKCGEDPVDVPCVGERMRDTERQAGFAVIENAIRRDMTVLEKASEAQRLIDRSTPIAKVAVYFGVSVPTVQVWLSMLGLAAPVKKAIEAGVVTPTAAAKWADMPKADQIAALELATAESGGKRVSVKRAERVANPDTVVRPSKKLTLAAIEAMKGTPWADGALFVLGMLPDEQRPDAVAALFAEKVAAE